MSTKNIIFVVLSIIFIVGMVWISGSQKPPLVGTENLQTVSETTTSTTSSMSTATITTSKGVVTLELFAEKSPKTVENFTKLANEGFYNGTRFHRVIKDFMIQGGDPLSKDLANENRWGTGGPGYQFADEIGAGNKNDIGTISMANSGPNTNGSQFFVNVANNNFLDTKHTVFGRVASGMEVITAIEEAETDSGDRPLEDMVIEKIEIK